MSNILNNHFSTLKSSKSAFYFSALDSICSPSETSSRTRVKTLWNGARSDWRRALKNFGNTILTICRESRTSFCKSESVSKRDFVHFLFFFIWLEYPYIVLFIMFVRKLIFLLKKILVKAIPLFLFSPLQSCLLVGRNKKFKMW